MAILQASGAVRSYDVPRTTLVTHLFHVPPRCSELPWHDGGQRDLRPSYKMYVGNDRGVGEEATLQGGHVAWPPFQPQGHLEPA